MDHVITANTDGSNLDGFHLRICEHEIVGLIPINHFGVNMLIRLLQKNLPLQHGQIYLNQALVNDWQWSHENANNVYLLNHESKLINSISVVENVFVFNRYCFQKKLFRTVGRRSLMNRRFKWICEELGVHIRPWSHCENLTQFERCSVELMRAIEQGVHLIVVHGIDDLLSVKDLDRFIQMLSQLAKQKITILYIGGNWTRMAEFCDRVVFMEDGRDIKTFDMSDCTAADLERFTDAFSHIKLANTLFSEAPYLRVEHTQTTFLPAFTFPLRRGECVLLYDEGKDLSKELDAYRWKNLFRFFDCSGAGKPTRLTDSRALVVAKDPLHTMLFYDASYIDNLTFGMQHKTHMLVRNRKLCRSVMMEYAPLVGADITAKSLYSISRKSLYQLIYYRIMLLKPKLVFIIQPFYNLDLFLKEYTQQMIRELLKRGISVILVSNDLVDGPIVANRVIKISDPDGKNTKESLYEFQGNHSEGAEGR